MLTSLELNGISCCGHTETAPSEYWQEAIIFVIWWAPSESALLPPNLLDLTEVSDYHEELMLSLFSARTSAASWIQKA